MKARVDKPKRIIFVNRYYWPDHSATAQLLTDLTRNLRESAVEVVVVTSRKLYSGGAVDLPKREISEGVEIYRLPGTRLGRERLAWRVLDFLAFYVLSFFLLLKLTSRTAIVVVKTDPPMMSVVAALVTRLKGARLVNWLQDLFPEIARELQVSPFDSRPVFWLARMLRNWSLRSASANVVLGERMAERVVSELVEPSRVHIIPNWFMGEVKCPVSRNQNPLVEKWNLDDRFVVGYSGNLGRAHDWSTILGAARLLEKEGAILFLIVGGGAGYDLLRTAVQHESLQNVQFQPYQPQETLHLSLSAPDLHLISLEPRLEGLVVPSKYYGILAAGKPLIFLGEPDGEIGRELREHELGKTVDVGDPMALAATIQDLADRPLDLCRMGARARRHFDAHHRAERSYGLWRQVLKC